MKKQLAFITLAVIFVVIASGAVSAADPINTNTTKDTPVLTDGQTTATDCYADPWNTRTGHTFFGPTGIQDAINDPANLPGDTIMIQTGIYNAVTLNMPLNLVWDGIGAKPIVSQIYLGSGASGSTITGLNVVFGAGSNPNEAGITLDGADGVTITDTDVNGWANNAGILLTNDADNNIITDFQITGNHNGIMVQDGSDSNTIGRLNALGDWITGTGTATVLDGYGIYLFKSINNTILGLTIGSIGNNALGFTYGIYMDQATGNVIDFPDLWTCGDGIVLHNSSQVTITNWTRVAYMVDDGIDLYEGSSATINGAPGHVNEINNNGGIGIYSENSTVDIQNNYIYNNVEQGIWINYNVPQTAANTIRNNSIWNNGITTVSSGIVLDNANGTNTIEGNTINGNGGDGIHVRNSNVSIQDSNQIYSNIWNGIEFANDSTGNITGNTIYSNGINGIYIQNCDKSPVLIQGNQIYGNTNNGIFLVNSVATINGNNNIYKNTNNGIESQDSTITVEDNTVGGPLPADGNTGNGIYIWYTVPTTNVNTIKRNTISNNGKDGINLNNAIGDNLIQNNTITSNTGNGINSVDSKVTIEANTIGGPLATDGNLVHGISIDYHVLSNIANTIKDNTISFNGGNNWTQVDLVNTIGNNLIQGNTISHGPYNGIWIGHSKATIQDNYIFNNGYDGIWVDDGSGGLDGTGPSDVTIQHNFIHDNGAEGIFISDNSTALINSGNEIYNNIANGIFVENSTATISNNSITGNHQNGIFVDPSTVIINNNVITDNWFNGVNVTAGSTASFDSNTISNNHLNGIRVADSTVTNITNNTIKGNWDDGILLINTTANTIYNNTIWDNQDWQIEFENSVAANGIISNNIQGNLGLRFDNFSQTVQFNRIVCATEAIRYSGTGTVNAQFNWYGSNAGPNSPFVKIFNTNNGVINFEPWLVLTINANKNKILTNGTSTVTADLKHDSTGVLRTEGTVPNGIPVNFSVDAFGTVNPLSGTTTGGVVTTTFFAGSLPGTANASATVDAQTVSTPIQIAVPPTAAAVPSAGDYYNFVNVQLTSNGGFGPLTIYFTTDGSTPTTSSQIYNDLIHFNGALPSSHTLRFLVVDSEGYSNIYSATYNLAALPTVSIDHAGGNFYFPSSVIVNLTSNGGFSPVNTYYSINGSAYQLYSGPLTINSHTVLSYYAMDVHNTMSPVYTETYNFAALPTVTANQPGGNYSTVMVTLAAQGGYLPLTIYYTTDGSTPTTSSAIYTGALNIAKTTTLKYFVQDSQGTSSQVYTQVYVIAPWIISSSPKNNTSGFSKTAPITVNFSKDIAASINWSKITLINLTTGKKVSFTKSIVGNTLIIKMSLSRLSLNKYQLFIPASAVRDVNGNNLINAYTLTFKTKK